MTQPPKAKRRRAGVCLLLYVLTAASAARVIAQSSEIAEQLGALLLPVAFLSAGSWFAYKDGGKIARVFASALVILALGSFGFGVIQG